MIKLILKYGVLAFLGAYSAYLLSNDKSRKIVIRNAAIGASIATLPVALLSKKA